MCVACHGNDFRELSILQDCSSLFTIKIKMLANQLYSQVIYLFVTLFVGIIDCYKCVGTEANSSCSDPQTESSLGKLEQIKCNAGACLKRRFKSKSNVLFN